MGSNLTRYILCLCYISLSIFCPLSAIAINKSDKRPQVHCSISEDVHGNAEQFLQLCISKSLTLCISTESHTDGQQPQQLPDVLQRNSSQSGAAAAGKQVLRFTPLSLDVKPFISEASFIRLF